MGLSLGIVGLPNVGKSTIFNALTSANIAAQNYPFCTIEPNIGVVIVPDARLDKLAAIIHPEKVIPTHVEFVDIAGLVKGAASGEGLGNQFLSNIRNTDAIAHVVRCFHDDDVIHVNNEIDPLNDIAIINTELLLADLETINKAIHKASKLAKGSKTDARDLEYLQLLQAHCNNGNPAKTLLLPEDKRTLINNLQLLTNKPTMYIANIKDFNKDRALLEKITTLANQEGSSVVSISAKLEAEIAELPPEEQALFLQELNLETPGLNRVIHTGYKLLHLITFFTAGPKEVRAWTIKQGTCAPDAAGTIHTDFCKGFIRAEIIGYNDYIQYAGEVGAKEHGKWRLEGKEYVMQDGDVVHFRFNV